MTIQYGITERKYHHIWNEENQRLELGPIEKSGQNFIPIFCDFIGEWKNMQRQRSSMTNDLLFKAIGKKSQSEWHILDATCGLGRDSMRFLFYGCHVTSWERSSIIYPLLADAHRRALLDEELGEIIKNRFQLEQKDAKESLGSLLLTPDVIYLDPMYENDATRTASAQKEMRILHDVVGNDEDAVEMLRHALKVAKERVVVKRSRYAPPLINDISPHHSYLGKSTRYDMYRIFK